MKDMTNHDDEITQLVNVLEEVKEIICDADNDLIWSRFKSEDELISELDNHILIISKEDFSTIDDLIILFGPTAALQEISISSGWGRLFIHVADKFDIAMKQLIKKFQIKTKFSV